MDLAITLDPQVALPLHRQLYEELRQAILTGRLMSGQRVPSTRTMAQSLGVSRATITLSYEQLKLWRRLLSRHCRFSSDIFGYAQDSRGYQPLREAIASYISRSRAVQCKPDQVIIVSGSQQALDLVTRLLIDRGDSIAMEDPGYLGARRTFLAQGACLHPVAVDESGFMVKSLATAPGAIKLVYVTPSHQFPTGAILSLPRRLELLAWAQKTGATIIEDDYDSEYRYCDRPIPALQGLGSSDSVIYIGTFSKV